MQVQVPTSPVPLSRAREFALGGQNLDGSKLESPLARAALSRSSTGDLEDEIARLPDVEVSTTPRLVTVAALCVLGSLLLSVGQWTNVWRTERVQHAAVAGGNGHGELVRPLRNIVERPSTPDHTLESNSLVM